MFSVENQLAKIVSCTNVSEKHGTQRVPALSIGFYLVGGGDLLDMFMRNLAWDKKYAGYMLRFHIGASGAEDVLLAECGLKDIRFTTQEGGSVGVHFKVTAHPANEVDHGKVATRLQQEIIITLTPPDNYVDPGLFSDAESDEDGEDRDPFEGSDLEGMSAN